MVSVVTLSYNTKETTLKCLECLERSGYQDREIIVVDNASKDGSAEAIAAKFPKVILIKNKENVGFAAGNNQGMNRAKGEWILLLNSDAFVFADTIEKMAAWAQANAAADMIGPQLLNRDGTIQPSWGYFPSLSRVAMMMSFVDNLPVIRDVAESIHVRSEVRYMTAARVNWLTGACVFLKSEVWKKTGGIDENYFMYGEEMEWMYRIYKAGFQTWYTPAAQVIHLGGASSSSQAPALIGEMKGWLYWWRKYYPAWELKFLAIIVIIGCEMRILVKPKLADIYRQAISEVWDQTFGQSKKQGT